MLTKKWEKYYLFEAGKVDLHFETLGSERNVIIININAFINVDILDNVLQEKKVTVIKIDIEGA